MEAVRTKNDLEGWHNGLNRRAKQVQPATVCLNSTSAQGSSSGVASDNAQRTRKCRRSCLAYGSSTKMEKRTLNNYSTAQ